MDLKIEIRKLYALHEATLRLEHAMREIGKSEWQDFTPSRFVYAFFTFNSLYSYDWESSFKEKKAVKWKVDEASKVPEEPNQIKAYLQCMDSRLTPDTGTFFRTELGKRLSGFGIANPVEELKHVDVSNASKDLAKLAKQLPGQFKNLLNGCPKPEDFCPTACAVLKLVYGVRCNLFHGQKTRVQLLKPDQQRRLLIYCAVLCAADAMLFQAAEKTDIGWQQVKVDFS